jgi:hypothetical protein
MKKKDTFKGSSYHEKRQYSSHCAVDSTPCDGRCREAHRGDDGQVYCNEGISAEAALGKKTHNKKSRDRY